MKGKVVIKHSFNLIYLSVALGFLGIMFYFKSNPNIQIQIVISSAIIYVAMALFTHHYDKSLTFEIIVEYILLALLVVVLLSGQLI